MSVVSKLQFTHATRSSHSGLSKQPQLVQSSKIVVASLNCAELGTAQPQLVTFFIVVCVMFSSCSPIAANDTIVAINHSQSVNK